MNIESIALFLNTYKIPIAVAVVVLVLICIFVARGNRKRQLRKHFEALEVKYNALMSIPILFKINKATGLAKVNLTADEDVEEAKELFSEINQLQEQITESLADTEDAIAFNKFKESMYLLENLEDLVGMALDKTNILDEKLNTLLEQEAEQRLEITQLKDRFREIKVEIQIKSVVLADANEIIEEHVHEIEHAFSIFEEWMYASDFEKAKEVCAATIESVDLLERRVTNIPKLYEVAKGHIPSLLDEISKMYQGVRQNGVYVDHLEVPKNIGLLSEILKDDLLSIRQGDIDKSKQSLLESQKRLEQLGSQIQKEDRAHAELRGTSEDVFETIDALQLRLQKSVQDASKVEQRFGFEGYEKQVSAYQTLIEGYAVLKQKIERMMSEEQIPASTILISVKELGQDVNVLLTDFNTLTEKVEQANADEVRARGQLMKLYLIINDVQVRIKRRSLPMISERYDSDVKQAQAYTKQIADMLGQEVIDVAVLNATVNEAIDYIYKLHNNVNNLVGAVDMCENAIVYANKFRSEVSDIDAELTRAELSFNNGEYTQALSMVINAIDRYKPDSSYEQRIRDNAKSAR